MPVPLGLGTGPLGNLYQAITDDQADATVRAAWDVGIRLFDTAPLYGLGLAERRLGRALADRPREEYRLSTKVGRRLVPTDGSDADRDHGFAVPATHRRVWDLSADGVRRSLDESLERLGLDRVDIALIHDTEESPEPERALAEMYPALDALRREGIVGAIGVGSKHVPTLTQFAAESDVDVLMVAGRYTLLEQPALQDLLPICERRGIRVFNVGVFNSGLLAVEWPDETRPYEYGPVPADVLAKAQAIAATCREHGVSLPRAALAFAGAHPAVSAVLVGAASPEELNSTVQRYVEPLPPAELWAELVHRGLLRPDAPVPT